MTEQPAPAEQPYWLGRRLAVRITAVAHGGHCVGRYEGRVVFVRHALPGESVIVQITEDAGGSFCRGDAVQVTQASSHRVNPPCPHAHPGGCGGCDFQHVELAEQRELKATVVAEQLHRLAGVERAVVVEPLGEAGDGLGWRRRIRYAVDPDGQLGLREHRSHRVIPLCACPLGAAGVGDAPALQQRWSGYDEVELDADDSGAVAVVGHESLTEPARHRSRGKRRSRAADRRLSRATPVTRLIEGPDQLSYRAADRQFEVTAGGFWQTHPVAADTFAGAVIDFARPQDGDRVLDLYAGAGLFTAVTAMAVGPGGQVLGLEGSRIAAADAERNLADLAWASVRHEAVTPSTVAAAADALGRVDVVVLDPPRTGAGRQVMSAVTGFGARALVYVACDPAALARDIAFAQDAGWQLTDLRAFDAFPMTHHVECVAALVPGS